MNEFFKTKNPINLLIDLSLYKFTLEQKEIFREIFLKNRKQIEVAKEYGRTQSQVCRWYHKCLNQIENDKFLKSYFRG